MGGLTAVLEAIQQSPRGLETVAWNLLGPKLWEKVAACNTPTINESGEVMIRSGVDYFKLLPVAQRDIWRTLTPLAKDRVWIPNFPATSHYTFQFWIVPTATTPVAGEYSSILHHGTADNIRSPAVWTCRDGGLHVRQDTVKGESGIQCTQPLPLNQCTLVSVVNRDGELHVYYNDQLVAKHQGATTAAAAGPVYLANPWYAPASASVVPVSAHTRALTEPEIARVVARTMHTACPPKLFSGDVARFTSLIDAENNASAFSSPAATSEALAEPKEALQTATNPVAAASLAQTSETSSTSATVEAAIASAQHAVCQYRLRSLAVRKLYHALRKSPIKDELMANGNTVRGLVVACMEGRVDPAALDLKLQPTRIGIALARIGGLTRLAAVMREYIASHPPVAENDVTSRVERDRAAWARVQEVIYTMGGGRVEHALHRCSTYQNLPVHVDVTTEGCETIARWGRGALPSFGYKLFDRAMRRSRVGHLYNHYRGLVGLAAVLRQNPVLLAQVETLLADTELGVLVSKHGGFAALAQAAGHSNVQARDLVWEIMSGTVYSAVAQCPEPTIEEKKRNRCRQRVVRRAMSDFYEKLENSALKFFMEDGAAALATTSGVTLGLEGLTRLPHKRVRAIAEEIEHTKIGRLLKPHGGLDALVEVARGTKQDMMQFVWSIYKAELVNDIERCAARPDHEFTFIQQCRDRLKSMYLAKFNKEVVESPLGRFVQQFGGFRGLARHNPALLNRLASLIKHHPISERLRRGGGLLVLLNTAKHDMRAYEAAVVDLYGAAAQAALEHCDSQAAEGAVSNTAEFMLRLKQKLTDPAFKRILDRALLSAHRPLVQSTLGQELVKLGGVNGLVVAASDANDADLAAYVEERLEGVPFTQSAIYGFIHSVGGAAGLRRLAQSGILVDATTGLQCQIVETTWLKRIVDDMGGCEKVLAASLQPHVLDEISQRTLGRPFGESGLQNLLGEHRGLAEAVLRGGDALERAISDAIVRAFAAQHGGVYAIQYANMVNKILDKIRAKSATLNKSLLQTSSEQVVAPAPAAGAKQAAPMPAVKAKKPAQPSRLELLRKAFQPHSQVNESLWDLPFKVIQDMPQNCPSQCSGHGRCIQNTGKQVPSPNGRVMLNPWECICDPGWTGTGCEVPIDQYIRFLLSHGRFAPPKCCDVCSSQAHVKPNTDFVRPELGYPMDPECASLEAISDENRRIECVRQALATRHRYVPEPTASKPHPSALFRRRNASAKKASLIEGDAESAENSFVEVEVRVDLPKKDGLPSYDATTTDALKMAEQAFAEAFDETARELQHKSQSLAEAEAGARSSVTGRKLAPGVLPGSAEDMYAPLTEEERAQKELQEQAKNFQEAYQKASISLLEAPRPAPVTPPINTAPFFTPPPLDTIWVEECCVPCDQFPDEFVEPKFPVPPPAERPIEQIIKDQPMPEVLKEPNDESIARAMQDPDYVRRGKPRRTNSWHMRMRNDAYVRRSEREPLLSEQKPMGDKPGCCDYCPFKRVPLFPPKKPNYNVKTPAPRFLEEDAKVADESFNAFIEESLDLVMTSDQFSVEDADSLLEEVAEAEPELREEIAALVGESRAKAAAEQEDEQSRPQSLVELDEQAEAKVAAEAAAEAEAGVAAPPSDSQLEQMLVEEFGEEAVSHPDDLFAKDATNAIAAADYYHSLLHGAQTQSDDVALTEIGGEADGIFDTLKKKKQELEQKMKAKAQELKAKVEAKKNELKNKAQEMKQKAINKAKQLQQKAQQTVGQIRAKMQALKQKLMAKKAAARNAKDRNDPIKRLERRLKAMGCTPTPELTRLMNQARAKLAVSKGKITLEVKKILMQIKPIAHRIIAKAKVKALKAQDAKAKPADPAVIKAAREAKMKPLPRGISAFRNPEDPNDVRTIPGKELGPIEGKKRMLGKWWLDVKRRSKQTFPRTMNLQGQDLKIDLSDEVAFVPKRPKKAPKCCNICPSVFSLRQTPETPWDDKSPAFEVNP